jgi:hypothetical protein
MVKIVKYILKCDNCDKKIDEDSAHGWIEINCDLKIGTVDDAFRPSSSFCSCKCAVEYFEKMISDLYKQVE